MRPRVIAWLGVWSGPLLVTSASPARRVRLESTAGYVNIVIELRTEGSC